MTEESQMSSNSGQIDPMKLQQVVFGSRKTSNYVVASMVSIGGVGFILAAISSYFGRRYLPIGNPETLIFVPQGLIMGFYGIAAFLIAIYLWTLISIDFGSGTNSFDKKIGTLFISRRGFLKEVKVEIPLKDVKAVKLEIREGISPRRRISLRVQGRSDLPLSGVGELPSLIQLEQDGAELARFFRRKPGRHLMFL